jgi:hypothetical protein
MKNKSNELTGTCHLSAEVEHPVLKGHVQETLDKVEGNVTAHDTLRCADARSDLREHSVLQCVPLQGQACFRCLCLLAHRIENSGAWGEIA